MNLNFKHNVRAALDRLTPVLRSVRTQKKGISAAQLFYPIMSMFGGGAVTPTNYQAQINAYKDWVYVCANKPAVATASVPVRLYVTKTSSTQKIIVPTRPVSKERLKYFRESAQFEPYMRKAVTVEEVTNHQVLDLFQNMNPFHNKFDMREMLDLDEELTGNAYWWVIRNESTGLPEQIWRLEPQHMQVAPDTKNYVGKYVYTKGIEKVDFPAEDIIHFKFPNPANSFYGLSPLAAFADTYNTLREMSVYNRAIFRNMGRLDGVFETEGVFDDEEFELLTDRMKAQYGGTENAGKFPLLEGGLKWKQVAVNPKDLEYLKGDDRVMLKIANAYGVPRSMLTSDKVNLANAKVGEYQFAKHAVTPRLIRQEEKINERLMPMYDENLFMAFDNAVPEDIAMNIKIRESNLKTGYTTINEEREKEGLEDVAWGAEPFNPRGFDTGEPTTEESEKMIAHWADIVKEVRERVNVH